MNCEKLHQDIEKLKEQYNSFSSKLDFSTKEAKGKIALSEQLRNTLTLQDQILESYLPDFFEKNPELLQLNLSDRIECKNADGYHIDIDLITQISKSSIVIRGNIGDLYCATIDENGEWNLNDLVRCKDAEGGTAHINFVTQISKDSIMMGGGDGTLYHATIDENGGLNLGNRIRYKDANGRNIYINSIAPLSDGGIMIGGSDGMLYHATIDENSQLNLSNGTECKNAQGGPALIYSITQLADDSIIICGDKGTFYRATMDENNKLNLGDLIKCRNTHGRLVSVGNIRSVTQLPDGSIMIGGYNDILYRAKIDKNGELILGDRIECRDADGQPAAINSIAQLSRLNSPLLSDDSIMIGGNYGTLYHATIDENGNVNLSDRIECEDTYGGYADIYSIAPLSDGSIMIGGWNGTLYRATIDQPTLSTLKQRINMIADKRAPK